MPLFSPLQDVISYTHPNGLRVLLKENHAGPLVSVHGWIHVGSVDETADQAGIAHVLEHMLFKGTARYRAEEISRWVEALGGSLNAETSKEYTHYYIDVPQAGAEKAVRLLGELLHRATLEPREWDRERPVILEEIKRRNDDPDVMLWDLLNEAVFQDDHLRRPVIGSVETVAAMSRDALWEFYRSHYRSESSVIVIAGDFRPRQARRWIEEAFGDMPRGRGPRRRPVSAGRYSPGHRRLHRLVKQTYLALAFPTPPSTHPDHEALDLLASILGDGRNSRLIQTLREKKKIVWSINTGNFGHEGPGLFSIFAECRPSQKSRVRPEVERIFQSVRRGGITRAELTRAKNILQSAWMLSFETGHQQASILGIYALDNQLPRLDSYLSRISAITTADLTEVAGRYLTQALSSAVVEP